MLCFQKQKLKNEESRLLNDESSDTDCISNSVDEVESKLHFYLQNNTTVFNESICYTYYVNLYTF